MAQDNKDKDQNPNKRQQPPTSITAQSPPPPIPQHPDKLLQAEEYLLNKGWEKMGEDETGKSMWNDPKGKRAPAVSQKAVDLPGVVGGKREEIFQKSGPPVPWVYSMQEAAVIQRQRDMAGVG